MTGMLEFPPSRMYFSKMGLTFSFATLCSQLWDVFTSAFLTLCGVSTVWNYAQAHHSGSGGGGGSLSVWVKLNSDEVRPLEVYASALHLSPQCWSNTAPRPACHAHADILALHLSFAVSGPERPWWGSWDTRVAFVRCSTTCRCLDYLGVCWWCRVNSPMLDFC